MSSCPHKVQYTCRMLIILTCLSVYSRRGCFLKIIILCVRGISTPIQDVLPLQITINILLDKVNIKLTFWSPYLSVYCFAYDKWLFVFIYLKQQIKATCLKQSWSKLKIQMYWIHIIYYFFLINIIRLFTVLKKCIQFNLLPWYVALNPNINK